MNKAKKKSYNKLLNPTPESVVALRGVFPGGAGQQDVEAVEKVWNFPYFH